MHLGELLTCRRYESEAAPGGEKSAEWRLAQSCMPTGRGNAGTARRRGQQLRRLAQRAVNRQYHISLLLQRARRFLCSP